MESLTPTIARRLGMAAVIVSALAVPAAAEASSTASLDLTSNTVTVNSAAGEDNQVRLVEDTMPTTNAPALRVVDEKSSAVAGAGCTTSSGKVLCPKPAHVVVNLGDGNDVLAPDATKMSIPIEG